VTKGTLAKAFCEPPIDYGAFLVLLTSGVFAGSRAVVQTEEVGYELRVKVGGHPCGEVKNWLFGEGLPCPVRSLKPIKARKGIKTRATHRGRCNARGRKPVNTRKGIKTVC
jgi:hypothetical protein